MRVALLERYGPPDVVRIAARPMPVPGAGEMVVRVAATSVGASDAAARSGTPAVVRLFSGLRRPRIRVLGSDFAGDVTLLGAGVTDFAVGDRVFGASGAAMGCHAEYVVVRADSAVVALPAAVTADHAVALADGAMTALPFLRDHARVQPGQRVLVNGASGAVGAAGVQLARHAGAHVTGVTSTKNIELVRGLGADEVIDHTADDFTASAQRWDVVFDAIGTAGFRRARRVLAPGGLYLSTQPDASVFYALVSRRAKVAFTGLRTDAAKRPDLAELAALAAAGTLVPVIDGGYPLAAAAAAHARVDTGHKRGTVVLHPQD